MLLEHRKAQYESQDDEHELSEVFTKTLEYCQTFSKYNSKETIKVPKLGERDVVQQIAVTLREVVPATSCFSSLHNHFTMFCRATAICCTNRNSLDCSSGPRLLFWLLLLPK
jgi:hypothetical protein